MGSTAPTARKHARVAANTPAKAVRLGYRRARERAVKSATLTRPTCRPAGRFLARPRRSRPMARGDVRIGVTLACEECKRRNYMTNKSKRNNPDRITLRKFCKWCRQHTGHRETR